MTKKSQAEPTPARPPPAPSPVESRRAPPPTMTDEEALTYHDTVTAGGGIEVPLYVQAPAGVTAAAATARGPAAAPGSPINVKVPGT